jgi:AraC-like DNA-binding protein
MAQQVSTVLVQLAHRAVARLGHPTAPPSQETTLTALTEAGVLRAQVAKILGAAGQRAVFAMAEDLPSVPFSPALFLLESSQGVEPLALRWRHLERSWGIQNRTEIRSDGASALRLDCLPYAGTAAPLSQSLMICGALVCLLRGQGYTGLGVAARGPGRTWLELAHDGLWLQAGGSVPEGTAAFRVAWSAEASSWSASRSLLGGHDAHASDTLRAALGALDGAVLEQWSPRRLADATGHSLRTLNRRLQACGTTAGALYRKVRMRAACIQIARTSRPLTEIAHDLGFSDSAHLSRELRRAAGMTPRLYRRSAATA